MKTLIKNISEPKNMWSGREVVSRKCFNNKGSFRAYRAAQAYVQDKGYSDGSMARNMPIGLMKGSFSVAKWYNLSELNIRELDGVIVSNDFREGKVEVILFKK